MNETTHQEIRVSIDFEYFPDRHTCQGEDISPRVRFEGMQRKLLAVILEDHDARERPYVHWVIWNVPARNELPDGISKSERPSGLEGAVQGSTTGGGIGYEGPCPPRGQTHKYEFKVYGYDELLELAPGSTRAELLKALDERDTQYGMAAADFGR